MAVIRESSVISGVYVVELRPFSDPRGRFMETFRKEWFPQRSWDIIQTNRSDSKAGVLRGLHYHRQQVDYWYVARGRIRAALADIRPSSPTYLATQTIEMGEENEIGLFIPIGVAHGFVALTHATLTYIVDNYYNNGQDEFGIIWNDPTLNINWGVTEPILSDRDASNPPFRPEKA
ncbi:MAG: dTDP-4-keto-6-deoxy-D-glucose epimerase [Chloroflexi bacterium]|nr:MAG: dTDP-4-keto-6-deoxy-D-glucose epimerase [Chloroflexota bacterium]